MRKIAYPDTQKTLVATLVDCNDCGHCQDLKTPTDADPPALTIARQHIKAQIISWLNPTPPSVAAFLQ